MSKRIVAVIAATAVCWGPSALTAAHQPVTRALRRNHRPLPGRHRNESVFGLVLHSHLFMDHQAAFLSLNINRRYPRGSRQREVTAPGSLAARPSTSPISAGASEAAPQAATTPSPCPSPTGSVLASGRHRLTAPTTLRRPAALPPTPTCPVAPPATAAPRLPSRPQSCRSHRAQTRPHRCASAGRPRWEIPPRPRPSVALRPVSRCRGQDPLGSMPGPLGSCRNGGT